MAFPSSPTDGQIATRFGRKYQYYDTTGTWGPIQAVAASTLNSVDTNIIPNAAGTIDIGSIEKPIKGLYLDETSTINIGNSAFTAESFLDFDLNVSPEVLEIQVDAPDAGHGQDWLWTWTTSALPYARIDITNSAQLSVPLYKQGTYTINNFANEIHGDMTQTHQLKLKWIEGAGDDNLIDWVTYADATASHPDINEGNSTSVKRLTVNVPENIVLPTLVAPSISYNVGAVSGAFTFTGTNVGNNIELGPMYEGGTYTFILDGTVAGHPFYLTTDNGTNYVAESYFGEYTTGVTGSRNDSGTVTFTVPVGAPSTLYYQCGVHSAMRGVITVRPLAVTVNNNNNYVVYAQHTQEGHATPVEIRPVPTLTSQMCLVYDSATSKFVPQDLATYVERTPAFKNKIQEVAGTATLIAPDGTSIVASVQVIADASYLPYSDNTDGDIAYTQDTQTLYIWDQTSYAWASTKGAAVGGGPKIDNIDITDSSYALVDDTAVSIDGGYIKITGSAFQSGCQILINNMPATSTTFISATEVRAQIPAADAGTYIVYLVNPNGDVAIRVNGITYSGTPTWVTDSNLELMSGEAFSTQLAATGAVSYALAAGSTLPAGMTLSSSGLLSGTITAAQNTTFNFTVNADDAEFQTSPRTFTMSVSVEVVLEYNVNWSSTSAGYTAWDYGRSPKGLVFNAVDRNGINMNTARWPTAPNSVRITFIGNSGTNMDLQYPYTSVILPGQGGGFNSSAGVYQILSNHGGLFDSRNPYYRTLEGETVVATVYLLPA